MVTYLKCSIVHLISFADCPFCPAIHCPHGQIMDADGCWTCECDCLFCGLHSQCAKSNGQCVCDHGYHHDSNLDCVKGKITSLK